MNPRANGYTPPETTTLVRCAFARASRRSSAHTEIAARVTLKASESTPSKPSGNEYDGAGGDGGGAGAGGGSRFSPKRWAVAFLAARSSAAAARSSAASAAPG